MRISCASYASTDSSSTEWSSKFSFGTNSVALARRWDLVARVWSNLAHAENSNVRYICKVGGFPEVTVTVSSVVDTCASSEHWETAFWIMPIAWCSVI